MSEKEELAYWPETTNYTENEIVIHKSRRSRVDRREKMLIMMKIIKF